MGNVVSPDVFFSFLTQWREHSFFNTEMFSILRFARYGKSQARPNGGGEGFLNRNREKSVYLISFRKCSGESLTSYPLERSVSP